MNRKWEIVRDWGITIGSVVGSFLLSLFLQNQYQTDALIPVVFVLGTFLTSVLTHGYVYGVSSALFGVLAVNFAFTFPYFHLNFMIPENLISTVIMVIVSLVTCGLTAKLKQQEAARSNGEKERMRANLLRAVSHDLRTPLTTICGSSSALLENYDAFTREQRETMLRGIQMDAQWLNRMVENLLSITRIGSGDVKIIKEETALDELVDSVLMTFSTRYPAVKVTLDIPEEVLIIPMDAMLIQQVLINLLENAVQHAQGMTKLSLRVIAMGNRAVFEIQDNGKGIDEDMIKSIFSGRYTPDAAILDSSKSNCGIGLSLCATIVKAHGGTIQAKNSKGGGALFRFTLDMPEEEDE